MTVYETFCGIGGFSLGFKRAGFEIIGGCEIDPYARAVYAKNFGIEPDGDVRAIQSVSADIICGGFPCQDISLANSNRKGLEGERSGLWWELARIIENSTPRWVVLENVPALLGLGMGDILRFFSEVGYDVEWDCLPAAAFGAPHRRDRIWIIAHANGDTMRNAGRIFGEGWQTGIGNHGETQSLADTKGERRGKTRELRREQSAEWASSNGSTVANPSSQGLQGHEQFQKPWPEHGQPADSGDSGIRWWESEPNVGRVANGISNRAHRIRCLGNAIVPQISQWIAERIKEIEMKG